VTGRRGRRHRKLLDDLKERRGYSHLKEKALDRTMWRAGFGRGFGPVVRQTAKWMDVSLNSSFRWLDVFLHSQLNGGRQDYEWVGIAILVGIANRYRLDGPAIESRWKGGFRTRPDRPGGPICLLYNGFPGGKPAGVWRWPPTPYSTEVKESVGLYLYSHFEPSWSFLGGNLVFMLRFVLACRLLVATSSCICS
jgi:hypothetical protein